MSSPTLTIINLTRRLSTGVLERLNFDSGVNLLVGRPNTGKTKWLQTLDFLLGDPGDHPFAGAEEAGLADKYDAAAATIQIAQHTFYLERRWKEPGSKTKVSVDGEPLQAREFQHWLLEQLRVPLLHFPKGNPMSGQTWPELSFRMLLRHIYRQQRFWSGIADQQPEGEQHACILQILGLAERVYTEEYGRLVGLKLEVDRLSARRTQYTETLSELARDVISEPGLSVSLTEASVRAAQARLNTEIQGLRQKRSDLLLGGGQRALSSDNQAYAIRLGERRAALLSKLEDTQRLFRSTADRLDEVVRYRNDLAEEIERLARAESAGAVLADLHVTHCPACDQPVTHAARDDEHCFLCGQDLPGTRAPAELGTVRLQFEADRLNSELAEARELSAALGKDRMSYEESAARTEEELHLLDQEIAPSRDAVSALVQEGVSELDVALGQAAERQRQLGRFATAVNVGSDLTDRISMLQSEIDLLQDRVDHAAQSTDFDAASAALEDGMNSYLNSIERLRPGSWRHNPVRIDLSRSAITFRIGARRWHAVLGGTDTLYFLMAYHFGLISLAGKSSYHYPGLSVIDLPGEFAGEAVEDKENFIVQPFIDLLNEETTNAQLIITGASFSGLEGAKVQRLSHVHVA